MRLFKAFNRINGKLTSNYGDETYEVGGTYTLGGDKPIELCKWGYHGCPIPFDCFRYHEDEELRMLTEIEVHGGLLKGTEDDSHKACFRSFTIVREVDPSTNGMFENFDGVKFWYHEGKLHREDGPAVEWFNGSKYWYKNGEIHREDGPAIEEPDGTKYWYKNGESYNP